MYNVMLVDDEPLILKGLSAIIDWSVLGLQIAAQAANGEEALERFLEMPIDIVITDIHMPGMSGLQLIDTIRSIDSHVKFLILSGYDDFPYVKEGIKHGIENYLLKPIDVDEMCATLHAAVEKMERVRNPIKPTFDAEQHILRDNILLRWVTRSIPDAEFRQRCEMVGISLSHSAYTVSVCRVLPPDYDLGAVSNMLRIELAAMVKELLQQQADNGGLHPESLFIFPDLDGDLIMVVSGDAHASSRERLHDRLTVWLRYIRQELQVRISLTIGSTAPGYMGVHESYAEAKELQGKRFINTEQSVVDSERPIGKGKTTSQTASTELAELIARRDLQGLAEFIRSAFASLESSESTSSADAHNCTLELLVPIVKLAGHVDLMVLFRQVSQLQTVEQLRSFVLKFLEDVFCELAQEREKLSPLIGRMIQDIHRQYAGELSLKTLSQAYRVHPVYLGQQFKKELRIGFSEYVNNYRMSIAKELLAHTPMKANEVALKVGYSDPNYFYKQFTKFAGVSPSEFRISRGAVLN